MSVDEARRLLLHDAARDAWGAEAALVLMEMLPPTGWANVATKHDLDQLEARLDLRIDHLDEKIEITANHLRMELQAISADGQRRMMQWTVATMIAMTGLTTGIATAIARLT